MQKAQKKKQHMRHTKVGKYLENLEIMFNLLSPGCGDILQMKTPHFVRKQNWKMIRDGEAFPLGF